MVESSRTAPVQSRPSETVSIHAPTHRKLKRGADETRGVTGESTPRFAIAERPRRRYPRRGGVEYEGQTAFDLAPGTAVDDGDLVELVESVLSADGYTYGDWFDLPMPLYLVHDHLTGDKFHALPGTDPPGLRRLFEGLRTATGWTWSVDRRTTAD